MRWKFVKLQDDGEYIDYAYSREPELCDGKIRVRKTDGHAEMRNRAKAMKADSVRIMHAKRHIRYL